MSIFQNLFSHDKSNFPDDENGDVLRRMQESGDDLSQARRIDFTIVFPSESATQYFSQHFQNLEYQVSIEKSGTVQELPWDVVISRYMLPTHTDITEFESELEAIAAPLGGRNDGWGCFEQ
jgi:hypothetical protein